MKGFLAALAVAILATGAAFARDPSFVRPKQLVGVRFIYKNTEVFQANFGGVPLSETGSSDGTTRTSAPIYFSMEPGRTYGLSFVWAPDENYCYTQYSGTVRAEFFADPDTESLVNGAPFGSSQMSVEFDPSNPEAFVGGWQVRLGSPVAVSPAIGQSRSLSLGDVNWVASLGVGATSKALDPLALAPNWVATSGLSRSKLTAPAGGEIEVINEPVGELRQVAVPQALVDIQSISNGLEIRFYAWSASTGKSGNLYTIDSAAQPMIVHRLTRPVPSSGHLVHARIVGIDEETTEIDPVGSNTWRRTSPGGLVIEERSQSTNAAGNIEELRVFKGPDLVSVRETLFEYHDFPWGREVIRRVEDPAGAALTTQYAFYDTPSQIATNGRLKHTILPDGNWVRQEYHLSGPAMGRVQRVLRPWLDAPSHPDLATPSNCVATTYAYVADWTGAVRAVSDETTTVLGTTTQRTATQWDFSQTAQYLFDAPQGPSAPITVATVSRYAGASAAPEVSVIKTLRASAPTPAKFWNKPVQIVAPNGVAADYRYQVGVWDPVNGVFTPNGYFPTGTDIAEYSTQSPLIVGKSLRTVTVKVAGLPVLNTVSVWDHPFGPNGQDPNQPATWLLVSTEETQYNASLKPVWRQRGPRYDWSTGVAWTATYSAEGRLDKEIGEDGVDVRYVYDAMGRATRKTIKGQANPSYNSITLPAIPDRAFDFTYDAANQVVQEKISGASESLVTNHVFDKAGRKTQTRVPGPSGQLTTTFGYSMLGTGGTQVTATAPDGGTSIQKTFRDGRKSAEEGTAQVNQT
ncbi:MAG: hypothetical protein HS122_14000 [Opitutaceae bacterium]|nr:hypothetical protein [Opitutaceae bacterium]